MLDMDTEELEALTAVYCMPGECIVDGQKITVKLLIDTGHDERSSPMDCKVPVTVVFTLSNSYPQTLPEVSLFSEHLSRKSVLEIKEEILLNFSESVGEPVLLAMSSFIQDEIKSYIVTDFDSIGGECSQKLGENNDTQTGVAVLHIDHMRSKNKYCKTLEKWAEELQLCGKIVFYRHLIVVLLQGNYDNIKDFILRLKTTNVDVDSRGHSCKEKMMKVLTQKACELKTNAMFPDFQRCEIQDEASLKQMFHLPSHEEVWECIVPLLKHTS